VFASGTEAFEWVNVSRMASRKKSSGFRADIEATAKVEAAAKGGLS
jgi:hypothetical protein